MEAKKGVKTRCKKKVMMEAKKRLKSHNRSKKSGLINHDRSNNGVKESNGLKMLDKL